MPTPMKRMRIYKRHFQLLELMVAAFILLVCLAPTLRIFTSMYLSQQNMTRENVRDHLAHRLHAKFVEQLYKRQISLEGASENQAMMLVDSDMDELVQKYKYSYECRLQILNTMTPRGKEKPAKYLGQIVIKLTDLAAKPNQMTFVKKFENQDPSESFYDYLVYIDSNDQQTEMKDQNSDKNSDDSPSQSTDSTEENSSKSSKPNPVNKKLEKKLKEAPL